MHFWLTFVNALCSNYPQWHLFKCIKKLNFKCTLANQYLARGCSVRASNQTRIGLIHKLNAFYLTCRNKSKPLKKLFLLVASIIFLSRAFAQDNCTLRISLLTCAPGSELYASFGHTALRVQDFTSGADLVYNYGTFEFSPDFYLQFITGKLLYSLSVENFSDFLALYQWESRSIVAQELQLNCAEKMQLYEALQINALEANRYYRYDFLYDNCTTRARDIVTANSFQPVIFKNILPEKIPSFRNLIHDYLDAGNAYWSKLGIDILLGLPVDKKVTNQQAMFLPDNLLKAFDKALVGGKPLAAPAEPVLTMPPALTGSPLFTPTLVFSAMLIAVVLLSFSTTQWARKTLAAFDYFFFFTLGMAGMLLLFMWFATNHTVCRNNFNLAWALPTNFVAAFFIYKRRPWIKQYFKCVFVLTLVLLVTWFFLPQQMNNSLLPVALLIAYRSMHLFKQKNYATKRNFS